MFDGLVLKGGSTLDVVFWQSLAAEEFVYLSDLEEADYRHIPYLDIAWPLARDRNLLGGPLSAARGRYLKGLAMHSAARVTYQLTDTFSRFAAALALDHSSGRRGSVVFRLFVAKDGQWHGAYTSDVIRGGKAPVPIEADISGAQAITLIVDFADRGDELDRAHWLDARLIR